MSRHTKSARSRQSGQGIKALVDAVSWPVLGPVLGPILGPVLGPVLGRVFGAMMTPQPQPQYVAMSRAMSRVTASVMLSVFSAVMPVAWLWTGGSVHAQQPARVEQSTVAVAAGLAQPTSEASHPLVLSPQQSQTVETLRALGLADSLGYDTVEALTTEVGPRLAGSEGEARARAWAVTTLTNLGFSNVRVEPFDVPYWNRGTESLTIVAPFPQALQITALGGSVPTPAGGVEAPIVRFDTLADLEAAPMGSLNGKIAFVDEYMTRTQDGSGYGVAVRKRSGAANAAGARGAVAAVIRSVGTDHRRFPHTGQMSYADGVRQIPIAALSAPDADQLARALQRGPVRVHLVLETDPLSGTLAPSGNVIGEIEGQTDEIIVLGAHLDSWDLGTGAVDDGAGVGIVIAAAKLLDELPGRPKRTIRVVLFGSEEVGLVGAKAYAAQHAGELDAHIIAAESDFGARKIWKFETRFGEDNLHKAKLIGQHLLPLGVGPGGNTARGGPDLGPLRQAGVPVVTLRQNGWDYFDLHHTSDDTFDKIDPDEMAQNVAVYAVFAYLASELEGGFRAEPVVPADGGVEAEAVSRVEPG